MTRVAHLLYEPTYSTGKAEARRADGRNCWSHEPLFTLPGEGAGLDDQQRRLLQGVFAS